MCVWADSLVGRTLPSRGKDRWFESGSAHFFGFVFFVCCVFVLYLCTKRFIKSDYLRYVVVYGGFNWKEILLR